ncbi:MAG: hypothetical protein P4L11_13645 [Geothrix sp.]|nr:hypothetical protein [Geothrix sp.]
MSGDFQPYLQPAVIIGVLGSMLKFLVADRLKQVTTALGIHEKRIRRTELQTAQIRGALRAKGCLQMDGCPLGDDDLEGDGQ